MTTKKNKFALAILYFLFAFCASAMAAPVHTASPAKAKPAAKAPAPPHVPIAPLITPISAYVPFDYAPFPYRGLIPDSGKKFIDKVDGDRHGHVSPRDGSVHWEDEIYKDNRVLLYLPQGFDIRKPALIVVFFHGNGATLARDVVERQQVTAQVAASGLNAVLVAPQFAIDAADSSAGRFWQRGIFAKFINEAATKLAAQYGDARVKNAFRPSRVVLIAYSGGYLPAAWSLAIGQIGTRLQGVVLLDALYGHLDKFADWIERAHRSAFFLSTFTESTRDENEALQSELDDAGLSYKTAPPARLVPGTIAFLDAGNVKHEDFVTQAWTANPVQWTLAHIPGYAHPVAKKSAAIKPAPKKKR